MASGLKLRDDVRASLEAWARNRARSPEEAANAILSEHLADESTTKHSPSGSETTRLRRAEETLAAIVDAVVTVDRHGSIEYMNPAAEELTACQLDDVRGRPVETVLKVSSPDADWITHQLVQTCLQEGGRTELQDDAVLHTRPGREIAVDGVVTPLRNESGNIVGAAMVVRDITARKRAEAALTSHRKNLEALVDKRTADLKALQDELLKKERLAALGHLTATVSHEIRNPLGTIRNSIHVLGEQLRGQVPGVDALFDRIDRNIVRCTRIISELLEYAQTRQLRVERVDLDAWLSRVLEEIESLKAVTVERDFAFGKQLDIDSERFRRAVINVCENAVQAMCEGDQVKEKKITVQTRALPGKAELVFIDTGPGMADEVKAQIFKELFSTKRFGVGLGLSIVKQILEQHGGEVHVQSTLGKGTRVIMRLPLKNA